MADEWENAHRAALADVVRVLKADPGVRLAAGDRVGQGGDPALPCVVVTAGRRHGTAPGAGVLTQVDAKVESRAATTSELRLLLAAVQAALSGRFGRAYQTAQLTNTGLAEDVAGTQTRRDTYALYVKMPAPTPPTGG